MDSANAVTPDERLVEQARSGDGGAFEELIRRHKRKIFGMAARIACDDLELEEIVQEVFIKAYEKLASFRGDAPFEHWLARIATNTCHDYLRKRKQRRAEVPVDLYEWTLEAPVKEQGAEPEELAALARALDRLRPDDRLVLMLLELEGKSVKETAYIMDISEGNVKVRAHRARKPSKNCWRRNWIMDDVKLDRLLQVLRGRVVDTTRMELGFETRTMAVLRQRRAEEPMVFSIS